jgi:hypothetical protein
MDSAFCSVLLTLVIQGPITPRQIEAINYCQTQVAPLVACAPGYEAACYARDHGTDGLRRSKPNG